MIKFAKETTADLVNKANISFSNIYGDEYSIETVFEQNAFGEYHFSEMDYRVRKKSYKDKFISILISHKNTKNTKEVLSFCNFIFLNEEDLKHIKFWRFKEKHNTLEQISLLSIVPYEIRSVMNIGYIVIPQDFFAKFFFAKMFMKISSTLIQNEPFSYLVPAGVGHLSSINRKNTILQNIDVNILGVTRNESKTSEVFAKKNGFLKLKTIYDFNTFGKVFVKYNP